MLNYVRTKFSNLRYRLKPGWTGWNQPLKALFPFFQRIGLTVIPNHYYHPVPDVARLPPDIWTRASEMVGVDMNLEAQKALAHEFATRYRTEYEALPRSPQPDRYQYYLNNSGFCPVDATVLYSMVRHFKPRRFIEIGSGFSTRLTAQALRVNRELDGVESTLTAIEPYPEEQLYHFPGMSKLIVEPVQKVPLSEFATLGENDILFIDSSHVVKMGSDVQYEFLEILPRLNPGVVVHVHDIYVPFDYSRRCTLDWGLFWNEQYFLHAFLCFNDRFRVLWSSSYMKHWAQETLDEAFPLYSREHEPVSFWMQVNPR